MGGLVVGALLVMLALLAPRYGKLSRSGSGWHELPGLGEAQTPKPKPDPLTLRSRVWRAARKAAAGSQPRGGNTSGRPTY